MQQRFPTSLGPWLSLLIPGCVFLVGIVVLLAHLGQRFVPISDFAVLELATRQVFEESRLLGPYSRFGWHHPGPAFFYFAAPFLLIGQGDSRMMFLAGLLVSAVSSLLVVAVVRRSAGELAARWTGAGLLFLLLSQGAARLTTSWNPYFIIVPVVLTMLLAAAASTSTLAFVAMMIVASFVVQSHLATAAVMGATCLIGLVAWWTGRAEAPADNGERFRLRMVVALLVLVLIQLWVPPLIDQLTGEPGNVTKLFRFVQETGHDSQPLANAVRAVTHHVTSPLLTDNRPVRSAAWEEDGWGRSVFCFLLIGAGLALCIRRRHDHPWILWLGLLSAVATFLACFGATRSYGPLYGYLVRWAAGLALPMFIGCGLALTSWLEAEPERRRADNVATFLVVLMLVPAAMLTTGFARGSAAPTPSATRMAQMSDITMRALADRPVQALAVRIPAEDSWPMAAGLLLDLRKYGIDARVDPEWTFVFGEALERNGNEPVELFVVSRGETPHPDMARAVPLVQGPVELWMLDRRQTR